MAGAESSVFKQRCSGEAWRSYCGSVTMSMSQRSDVSQPFLRSECKLIPTLQATPTRFASQNDAAPQTGDFLPALRHNSLWDIFSEC